MMLILHILIALTSLGLAVVLWWRPTSAKLYASYGLMAATIASGTYLIWSAGSHMLEACTMGLIYIGLVSAAMTVAHRKLAAERSLD